MNIKFYQARGKAPAKAHPHDSGWDLVWNPKDEPLSKQFTLQPGLQAVLETGAHFAIPPGWEGQVRPRSGMAAGSGIMIVNSPGTVDAEYLGEVRVILHNSGRQPYYIKVGDRIAQIVFQQVPDVGLTPTSDLQDLGTSARGANGCGSSGR